VVLEGTVSVRNRRGTILDIGSHSNLASQFYYEITMDPSLDKMTLQKMAQVYSVKPFDNTAESKQIFKNVAMENSQLVNKLGLEYLEDLHRYEGSFYCTKGYLMAIGGYDSAWIRSAEVLTTSCDFPLPEGRYGHISVTTTDGKIMVCGGKTSPWEDSHGDIKEGYLASCLQFNSGTWEHHSSLENKNRYHSSAIALKHGVYILGGVHETSSEFLATGTSNWIAGPEIPGSGAYQSCAVKLSDTEFVILGGRYNGSQALVYSTTKEEWTEWPTLSKEVYGQSCVKFGDQILMAGGWNNVLFPTKSTVILDIKTGLAREVASLNYPRGWAAMEVYEGKPLILGGKGVSGYRSDGEIWNTDTETWEKADISLNIRRGYFTLVATDEKIKCE